MLWIAASFVLILLVEAASAARSIPAWRASMEWTEMGVKRAFFRSEGNIFAVDIASERMFRMDGVNLIEISDFVTKLKISLEGAIMDESSVMKRNFSHSKPPEGFLTGS
jgi:hypothetical protein